MQLRRIEVHNFRRLDHLLVEDLQDGLNVVVGDNEAGKSTLLAALRAVLFERHRVGGEVAERMLPFGKKVSPRIAVEFDLDGQRWKLRKTFVQKQEAELIGPGERLEGDEVEDRLARLLGFTSPARGGSDPRQHQGAHGLLWVEQGAAHRSLGVGAGRESIASALESEVGQVLGGERGRLLLSAAEKRRLDFWGKANKPKGPWKVLQEEVAALEDQKAELEDRFASYDDKISDLTRKQERLDRYRQEGDHPAAVAELARARAATAEAEQFERAAHEAETQLARATAEWTAASDRRTVRQALLAKLAAADRDLGTLREELDEAKSARDVRAATARDAAQRLKDHRDALDKTDEAVAAVEEALARREAEKALRTLEGQLARCEEAESKRRAAVAESSAIALTQKDLDRLEEIQRDLDQKQARLQAASVRIEFTPDAPRRISVAGQDHDPSAPLLLSQDAELSLQGFGRLTIHPGGGVGDLARETEDAARALTARLRGFGVEGLAQARRLLRLKQDSQKEAEAQRHLVASLAPQGLDSLSQSTASQRAALARALSPAAAALPDATEATKAEAQRRRAEAAEALRLAEAESQRADASRAAADLDLATRSERATAAKRNRDQLGEELSESRASASDDQLESALARAGQDLQLARQTQASARAALESSDLETARLDLRIAEKAEAAIREDIARLEHDRHTLRTELSTLGEAGIGEKLAEIEGQLALKRRQLAQQDAEAQAARYLHDALGQAQQESKDQWLGPVRERVRPYLRILHPDSEVVLDEETLEIEGFVRDGQRERFEDLSMGAREQVAVITRLALADLLRGARRPSAVILDDALVNTDEDRLRAMHRVLAKAADRLQVLVLTCRERDFLRLGAPITRIR